MLKKPKSSSFVAPCLLCAKSGSLGNPRYSFRFKDEFYAYYSCASCGTLNLSPLPSQETIKLLYSPEYHSTHYDQPSNQSLFSPRLRFGLIHDMTLRTFLENLPKTLSEMHLLDYGCGSSVFLKKAASKFRLASGIEFSPQQVTKLSRDNPNINYFLPQDLDRIHDVDVIHIGDVLEHVDDPIKLTMKLYECLKPGGYMLISGPLENGFSLTTLISALYDHLKVFISASSISSGHPYHLFKCNYYQFRVFIDKSLPDVQFVTEQIYETGWPYIDHTFPKSLIGSLSVFFSFIAPKAFCYGNRYMGLFRKPRIT